MPQVSSVTSSRVVPSASNAARDSPGASASANTLSTALSVPPRLLGNLLRLLDELLPATVPLRLGAVRCGLLRRRQCVPCRIRQVAPLALGGFAVGRAPLLARPVLERLPRLGQRLVPAAALLVLKGEQLGLAGRPLAGIAALAPRLDLLEQALAHLGLRVVARLVHP